MAYSRKELEDIIDRGECVILDGVRAITKKEDLPSAIELAGNDIVKKAHAVGDIKAAMAELQKQLEDAGETEDDIETGDEISEEEKFAISLSSYPFIGKKRAKALLEAGYGSRGKILATPNEELAKVAGFEEADKIEALRKLLNG